MFRTLMAFCLLATIAVGGGAGLLYYAQTSPATVEIESDISDVRSQILEIEQSGVADGEGLIHRLAQLRLEVLRTTEAMLTQKRSSLLRRIDLNYVVAGVAQTPADPRALQKISDDLKRATAELQENELNARLRGSGGLLGVLALMTVETNRMSVAQLEFSYYSAKYGFVMPFNITAPNSASPPGSVVDDRSAL